MLALKLFMLASSFVRTLMTTGLFIIQPQTSSQDVDDDLPGRVEVLETQVGYLSTRVAVPGAGTPEPTQTPQDGTDAPHPRRLTTCRRSSIIAPHIRRQFY